MAKPHAYVADNDRCPVGAIHGALRGGWLWCAACVGADVEGLSVGGDDEVSHPEKFSYDRRGCCREVIDGI
ncbi:MAG: hypothetical protein LKI67_11050 [Olsenella sp.]|nr:hypothetical protein [Olsenella sp.]MCH3957135.1 hypothetical protein [Olsenella sp.]MCI1646237.1 hypothetical protein [Olsenella sp.]MCI1792614.1 hypothetical protein [Olsenella sp.]MCI1812367.1 hypothetical protein [Olsenella sp.]